MQASMLESNRYKAYISEELQRHLNFKDQLVQNLNFIHRIPTPNCDFNLENKIENALRHSQNKKKLKNWYNDTR